MGHRDVNHHLLPCVTERSRWSKGCVWYFSGWAWMPGGHHLFWWEAPRSVLLWVTWALTYLRFSAKVPGNITRSSLPGKENNTRGSGKTNFCSQGEMPRACQSWSAQSANQAGWFGFSKVKASCFPWDVLQISSAPRVLGLSATARKKERRKEEHCTEHLYIYI